MLLAPILVPPMLVENGPTPHPMITDPPTTDSAAVPAPREKLDSEFSEEENKLEMADTQAEIILSQGLPRQYLSTTQSNKALHRDLDNVKMLKCKDQIYTHLKAMSAHAQKDSQENRSSSYKNYANLLSVSKSSFHPPTTQHPELPPTQDSNATVHDGHNCTNQSEEAPEEKDMLLSSVKDLRERWTLSTSNKALLMELKRKEMHVTYNNIFKPIMRCKYYFRLMKAPMLLLAFHGQLSIHSAINNLVNEIDDIEFRNISKLLDTEAQNVPTEVSADTSDKLSMIAILTDLQTQLDGHAKVNQEKCLEIETLKNELLQCKQEICRRRNTHKVKLILNTKNRQGRKRNKPSKEAWFHQVVSMKKMNEKPGHVRPANDFYAKLNALMFVPQKELSGDQAYWLSANEIASQASKSATPDLRSACDREHTKVLELEAEISKQKQLITDSEKRFAFLEQNYLRQQLQGKDDIIRKLDAQISIMKVLNIGSTEGSCDQQALETDRIQLQDTITSLRIQLDGLKIENVSMKRRYDELSKANTHSRTTYTEKLSAFTAENTKLKAQVTGTTSSGPSTSETPKVLAPGMYNLGSKYIPPPKRANWVKPTPLPKKKQVTFSEPPKPSLKPTQKPVEHPNNSLPVKSTNARRVEAHHRTLNKKNRVDSNLLVKHSVSVSKMNNVCGACNKPLVFANHTDCLVMCDGSMNVKPHQTKRFIRQPKKERKPVKRIWKPISKPVANSKPQWKPTGRHFSLFEKHPLTLKIKH
ncbi:hypothetical protein Tco_0461182 [Tanacetum coccineum]